MELLLPLKKSILKILRIQLSQRVVLYNVCARKALNMVQEIVVVELYIK
jgi:hypothetical protein